MKRLVLFLTAGVAMLIAGFGVLSQASASTSLAAGDSTFTEAWNGAGSNFLPCSGTLTWEFNLAGPTEASSASISVDGATYPGTQTGQFSWSFTSPGTGVSTSSSVIVTYTAPKQLAEAAVVIVSCDVYETTTTTTPPTTTPPTTTQTTTTTTTTTTTSTTHTSTLPTESTRTSTTPPTTRMSTLPSESTRPSPPTAIEAGIGGPTTGSGAGGSSSHVLPALGILGGIGLAGLGAYALTRRRGQHEA